LRAALLAVPDRFQEKATFAAPFLFGAAVLGIGIALGLPEITRLWNVIRRRKT
jgi:hypothetical protein